MWARAVLSWLRGWRLWTHTSLLGIIWLLTCEVAITVYVAVRAIHDGMPTAAQWTTFALLSLASALYMLLTWPEETATRAARVTREHIDHTGTFTVAAAFVLPLSLMVVLVVAIRVVRYVIASKPPVRTIFGTAATLASCIVTQTISSATGLDAAFAGSTFALFNHKGIGEAAVMCLSVIAACVADYAAQTILVGMARGLGGAWSWRGTIGTAKDNGEFAAYDRPRCAGRPQQQPGRDCVPDRCRHHGRRVDTI